MWQCFVVTGLFLCFLFFGVYFIVNRAIDKPTGVIAEIGKVLPASVCPVFHIGEHIFVFNRGINEQGLASQFKLMYASVIEPLKRLRVTNISTWNNEGDALNIRCVSMIKRVFRKDSVVMVVKSDQRYFSWPPPAINKVPGGARRFVRLPISDGELYTNPWPFGTYRSTVSAVSKSPSIIISL